MELHEIWNRILERGATSLGTLTPNERTVYRVNLFCCEMQMQGLSGFLYNLSPAKGSPWSELRETAGAVETVGHPACASLLRELADRLEKLPTGATTWGAHIAPIEEDLSHGLAPTIGRYVEDVLAGLETFTMRHLGN